MPAHLTGNQRYPTLVMLAVLCCAASVQVLPGQEVRGLAKLDMRGDAVWGANVLLIDSLGREAGSTRTNRKGEFSVRAPLPGSYWLQLSARMIGRNASPVFVLDSGATMFYEHVFRRSLSGIARGEEFTAQTILREPFRDSTAGSIERGVSGERKAQVRVTVLDARSETPLPNAEVAIIEVDGRAELVKDGRSSADGSTGWTGLQPAWYRVVARRIGLEPGGSHSFPVIGDNDSISVVLRLHAVTVLDAVTVMEQRLTAFGFNLRLMSRYFLGGGELRDRNPSARNVDDLITSLRIPGLSIKTGDIESQMTYRGQRVKVFILDGSRTNGELPLVEPSAVESLMFIPPHEAGAIFGPDASGGVLIINTRQR